MMFDEEEDIYDAVLAYRKYHPEKRYPKHYTGKQILSALFLGAVAGLFIGYFMAIMILKYLK